MFSQSKGTRRGRLATLASGGTHGSRHSSLADRRTDPAHHPDPAVLALNPGRGRQSLEDLQAIRPNLSLIHADETSGKVVSRNRRGDAAGSDGDG